MRIAFSTGSHSKWKKVNLFKFPNAKSANPSSLPLLKSDAKKLIMPFLCKKSRQPLKMIGLLSLSHRLDSLSHSSQLSLQCFLCWEVMRLKWNQLGAFCCQGVRRSLCRCVFLHILWEKNRNTLSRSGKCWMHAKCNWWKWHYCQKKFSKHEGGFMFYCFFITVFEVF